METRICNKDDCEHGGKPQNEDRFAQRSDRNGRVATCRDCLNRAAKEKRIKAPRVKRNVIRKKTKAQEQEETDLFNLVNVRW